MMEGQNPAKKAKKEPNSIEVCTHILIEATKTHSVQKYIVNLILDLNFSGGVHCC